MTPTLQQEELECSFRKPIYDKEKRTSSNHGRKDESNLCQIKKRKNKHGFALKKSRSEHFFPGITAAGPSVMGRTITDHCLMVRVCSCALGGKRGHGAVKRRWPPLLAGRIARLRTNRQNLLLVTGSRRRQITRCWPDEQSASCCCSIWAVAGRCWSEKKSTGWLGIGRRGSPWGYYDANGRPLSSSLAR
ncbi:L-lactate dehydrogenase B chain [Striga asiatica]|uniref:L-lactate dehydrogenase B chain n=1 Tax=Striga asiatica TaxID=4170 RepID=A0A5A7P3G7_STRAF|nr:L-lactate dehydrogenase B chain [Striga asiatica]